MKGWSLHIGVKSVDAGHYGGTFPLNSPHHDAAQMREIARSSGFIATVLPTDEARYAKVVEELRQAALGLSAGDYFLLTYSGHGGQVPDRNGDELETDGLDETWCLFDRMLVDDEIYACLARFRPGVRILVVSDSCHSGSVVKGPSIASWIGDLEISGKSAAEEAGQIKTPPAEVVSAVYQKHQGLYDQSQRDFPQGKAIPVLASVIQLSACRDGQKARDGPPLSLFTQMLKTMWESHPTADLGDFFRGVVALMPSYQTPQAMSLGPRDLVFESLPPFTIR
jgi:metacaspase-1